MHCNEALQRRRDMDTPNGNEKLRSCVKKTNLLQTRKARATRADQVSGAPRQSSDPSGKADLHSSRVKQTIGIKPMNSISKGHHNVAGKILLCSFS